MMAEPKLSSKYPTWVMPGLWYEQQIQIGPNGEKMGLLHVDSCLAICATKLSNPLMNLRSLDADTKQMLFESCD